MPYSHYIRTEDFIRESKKRHEVFLRESEERHKAFQARIDERYARSPFHLDQLEITDRTKISDARLLEVKLLLAKATVDSYKPVSSKFRDNSFERFQDAKEKGALFLAVAGNVFLVVATLASCTTNAVKSAFHSANAEAVKRPKAESANYQLPDDNKPVVNVVVDNATKRPALKTRVFMNHLHRS